MPGPLQGVRVIEMLGLGPCPFAGMMLADMGAEVVRIARPQKEGADNFFPILGTKYDVMARGRRTLTLDLKLPTERQILLDMLQTADILIEGFRPGVMEKFGLGPAEVEQCNPQLVYGRVTGWGQDGPLAQTAGHDINYLALSGMLHAMGNADRPPAPPLNLVADFGGGAMMLAFGVVCALWESRKSGRGQVVDAAMVDGSALLGAMLYGFRSFGDWKPERESNLLDGGAHFYNTYRCADGKFISVGAIEAPFYQRLLHIADIQDVQFQTQMKSQDWPALKLKLADIFASKTRQAWCDLFEGSDACVAPVLDMEEAPHHPHNLARENFIDIAGVKQPAPAPRFSRTTPVAKASINDSREEILRDWGKEN